VATDCRFPIIILIRPFYQYTQQNPLHHNQNPASWRDFDYATNHVYLYKLTQYVAAVTQSWFGSMPPLVVHVYPEVSGAE
jgi:hypothetical protein